MKRPKLAVFLAALLLPSCTPGESVRGPMPRETRPERLRTNAGAVATRESAGSAALRTSLYVEPSFLEFLLIPSDSPAPVAYPFALDSAELVEIEVRPHDGAPIPLVDIFERVSDDAFRYALARRGNAPFTFAAPAAGQYVLRVQPENGGGRYRVSVRGRAASVVFPVAGADASAIRSAYGEARDDGARSHGGVDIFAPRHTPVLSVSDAIVEAVQNTAVGGRVIWAKDVNGELSYFYAHLEKQLVKRGQRIAAGDTIGTVGNSGNARGASPHLHFGVYRPGTVPVNPLPLLGRSGGQLVVEADTLSAAQLLGSRALTRGDGVRLRGSPDAAGALLAELPSGTRLRITGLIGDWRRVVLEDGRSGFIASRLLQPAALTAQ